MAESVGGHHHHRVRFERDRASALDAARRGVHPGRGRGGESTSRNLLRSPADGAGARRQGAEESARARDRDGEGRPVRRRSAVRRAAGSAHRNATHVDTVALASAGARASLRRTALEDTRHRLRPGRARRAVPSRDRRRGDARLHRSAAADHRRRGARRRRPAPAAETRPMVASCSRNFIRSFVRSPARRAA